MNVKPETLSACFSLNVCKFDKNKFTDELEMLCVFGVPLCVSLWKGIDFVVSC